MHDREEVLHRLRTEDESLDRQIATLEEEANHRSPGIRQYRHQRVDQLRNRQHSLRARVRRVESHPHESWDEVKHEAEKLWFDLHDVGIVAAQTFH